MVGGKRLREIAATRKLLMLQSDIHRSLVAAEARQMETSLAWVESLRRAAAPAAPLVAGVAGMFTADWVRSLWRWVPLGYSAFRAVRHLRGFWRSRPGT